MATIHKYNIDFDIAGFRFDRRLRQIELAEHLKVSQGLISYCERHNKVSRAIYNKLCDEYGQSVAKYRSLTKDKVPTLEELIEAIKDKGIDVKLVLTANNPNS